MPAGRLRRLPRRGEAVPCCRGLLLTAVAVLALSAVLPPLHAAALKVDFNMPGRNDSVHPAFESWFVPTGAADEKTFGPITVRISAAEGVDAGLTSTWWKPGMVQGARMAIDGVTVSGGDAGAAIELQLHGLTSGRHSFAAFLNELNGGADETPARVDVWVDGARQRAGARPSYRVLHDDDVSSAFVEFEATAGKPVVIRLQVDPADTAATRRSLTLNGFEIDGSDPARRASKPWPAHRDEHVDADQGEVTLRWSAPSATVAHQVYFGTSRDAVAGATTDAPEFRGRESTAVFAASALSSAHDYYWRVDAVDTEGRVTRGDVWRFRARQLAFPGAEGYGRFARGGRGGRVLKVTNLNDSGPGSLRAAVDAEGARTVVFEVGGLITLESKLVIKNPYLTIAGQTAPGKGITIRKYNLGMSGAHDVIIRHVRVRPGDIAGVTMDGMGMAGSDHCIIDHCSISWSQDEAFSSRAAKNITLQRTLISEALNVAGHKNYKPGTQHGYAASISGDIGSFHHNLLAHCAGRNWSLAGGLDAAGVHAGRLDIRNNVVFNWGHRTTDGGAMEVNFVNNYYKPGPATKVFHVLKPERNHQFGPQDYFVAGNVMEGRYDADEPLAGVEAPRNEARKENFLVAEPFFESHVTTRTAAEAFENVLNDVGCTVPMLDDHDRRVIAEVRSGKVAFKGSKSGLPGLPDSQQDVGGWEEHPEVRRPADWDVDGDAMPDAWERARGLNPNDPADGAIDPDGDGFTNLEDYLNGLAAGDWADR